MLLDQDTAVIPRNLHLTRWFLTFGAFGFVLAMLLAVGLTYDIVTAGVVLTLWPTGVVQLIDPQTVGSKIAVGLVAYGGNFILYGLVGAGLGFSYGRVLQLLGRR